jgi:hypothetical protein
MQKTLQGSQLLKNTVIKKGLNLIRFSPFLLSSKYLKF